MKTWKTSVEISEELFQEARRVLETKTVKETLNEALKEVLRAEARRQEVESLGRMEGMDLDNAEIMAGAWRS